MLARLELTSRLCFTNLTRMVALDNNLQRQRFWLQGALEDMRSQTSTCLSLVDRFLTLLDRWNESFMPNVVNYISIVYS